MSVFLVKRMSYINAFVFDVHVENQILLTVVYANQSDKNAKNPLSLFCGKILCIHPINSAY